MSSISLIMTNYNYQEYIGRAIESCLNQTFKDFELIIIDDGSTDDSISAIERHQTDSRIKLLIQDNKGQANAQINAIKHASGEYIGWVDSDDMLDKDCLKTCIETISKDENIGMVYTKHLEIDVNDRIKADRTRTNTDYDHDKLLINFMTFHFRLVRRSTYDLVGGIRENYNGIEDYDLCLRISEKTTIKQIKKQLYYYRIHDKSHCQNNQLEQLILTKNCINETLKRRGMNHKLKIKIEILKSRTSLINI